MNIINKNDNRFWKRRWVVVFILPLIFICSIEVVLSLAQISKWRTAVKPYHVTPVLRPIIRLFVQDDFYPRTHNMRTIPWDYRTDRMKPGKHHQDNGLPDYMVNSYGIRGEEFTIPKPKDIYRIVVFGGSSTLGAESQDNMTYPAILQKLLNTTVKGDKKIGVLNYGVSSKSMYYITKHYFSEVNMLEPDLVIINNIRNTWFYDRNQEICNYSDITGRCGYWAVRLNHYLTDNLLLFRFLRRTYEKHLFKRIYNKSRGLLSGQFAKYFDSLYYDAIHSIYKDTHQRGIRLAFILESMYYEGNWQKQLYFKRLSSEQLRDILDDGLSGDAGSGPVFSALLYNSINKLKANFQDVIIIDPVETLIRQQVKNTSRRIFFDYLHLTEKGNKILADFIAKELISNGITFD